MALSEWILERGGDLQAVLFFGGLIAFGGLERLIPRRPGDLQRRSRWLTNGGLMLLTLGVMMLVPLSFIGAAVWAQSAGVGLLHSVSAPLWAVALCTLAVRAFVSFFTHWLNHKLPWLWRLHRVHHLDTELDVSSTLRFHPLEMVVGPLIGMPIIVAFGLSPWVLAAYELLDASITVFSHSNVRLPLRLNRVLRYLIVTPDLHRVHHSTWQPETDSNYGAVFPVWDLVFGTFRPEARDGQEHMQLGLAELREPQANRILPLLLSPLHRDLGERRAGAELGARAA
jgi:sterol desaturase/sphingolipid hydroxylase (fatty acid hydroxylase superfamily)